jgi:hypothetical protein
MGTAKQLATLSGWNGEARVYELDPPMDDDPESWRYVIVSAVDAMFSGPETYIFPAEKTGDVFTTADMCELDGSFKGALDHEQALSNAGYEVLP